MTAAVAYRRQTAPAARRTAKRPELRVLDQAAIRRRARRRNAVLMLFLVVLSAFFVVAFVHATLVESQQDLDLMRAQIGELETEKARIARAVDEASSPATIVEGAEELGMVRAAQPVYLEPAAALEAE
ncbi:MAG: hypothetical protein ACFCVK_10835 [Acidimicrobiales bacterium]